MEEVTRENKKDFKENMKEFLKENKKGLIIGLIIVTIIGIAIVLLVVFGGKKEEQKEEDKLKGYLNELGKSFYEDYYYDAVESQNESAKIEFLTKFTDIGIKVNLDNLSRYNGGGAEEKTKEFKENSCNEKETKIIVYPKAPYGKTDYEVETILECDFDKK